MDYTRRCKTNLCFLCALIMDTNVLNFITIAVIYFQASFALGWTLKNASARGNQSQLDLLLRCHPNQISIQLFCSISPSLCLDLWEFFTNQHNLVLKSCTYSSALFFLIWLEQWAALPSTAPHLVWWYCCILSLPVRSQDTGRNMQTMNWRYHTWLNCLFAFTVFELSWVKTK